ncbi:uncharacterized protein EDB93DRAFT_1247019 [Suillus bovinus]|uniref:uncharacterized protein n=1 Tax=Suillus bovinus TaxID=48563 RepID=UPI001B8658D9|nr:uncharacterized protein EDB93DRAFT_1247019 [Suillus bovinus]KAG2156827.1 hypothetical protein EDB93DRAFT_1247019 [Suillus bovinus]
MPRQHVSPPPYYHSSSEASPLIPRESYRRYQYLYISAILIVLLIAFTIVNIFISLHKDPLDPDVRERIRKDWDIELRRHEEEVFKRIDTQKRWRLEDNDRIRLRDQWENEVKNHEREVEERRKHEEEERLRLNMFWTDLASHTCTTYATREYTAQLVNVPSYYNRRVEACMATPVKIHGVDYTPKWCEDHGPNNVIGHWEVDQHEPDCASYWTWYKDFGCTSPGSGQRRIEHLLANLPVGGDGRSSVLPLLQVSVGCISWGHRFASKGFATQSHRFGMIC